MPYKDINQQRERARLAMRILRAQRKGLTAEEIARLTTDGLTQQKRVNSVNKTGLTDRAKTKNSQFLNSQIFTNFLTEIRNSQQIFLTQIEKLVRSELGKSSQKNSKPPSQKITKQTTFQTKSPSPPGKFQVDSIALEKATGLKRDWRPNSPWKKVWKAEYNRLYKKRLSELNKKNK